MSSLSIQQLMSLINTQINILLDILSMDSPLAMMQAANQMFSYNVEVYQYSELLAKLMKVFLNSVNSFLYSRGAGSDNDLNIIKEQLQRVQRALQGPHHQIASILTQQATYNRELLKHKLYIMAAVQPIILITSYAATFNEYVIAIHNPLEEEIVEEEVIYDATVINISQE